MPATPDPNDARRHRHEFILRYYEMARADLDRHLKAGWETIAVAAGSVALLSSAEQGYLPVPVACMLAIGFAFWGILQTIDANYWASRAIAFLANVEALYFYEQDREVFNPYAGQHPPAKFLGALRPQLVVMFLIILATSVYFAASVASRGPAYADLAALVRATHPLRLAMWLLPIAAFVGLTAVSVTIWVQRKSDYLDFVTYSPGPGILRNRARFRDVLLAGDAEAGDVIPGSEVQKDVRESLERSLATLSPVARGIQGVAILIGVALVAVVIFKNRLFP
jgi:hypothetical protein